jgi:soluble lytic murein transglycosylase-like protein
MRRVGLAAGTLLLATAAAGCAGDGPAADDLAASAGVTVEASAGSTTAAPTPAAAPVEQGLGRGPTPTPSKTTTPKPKPKAPPKPVAARDIPPPLAPEPVSPDCTGPKYVGTQASRAAARDALVAAANTVYWPTSAPEIKVPVDLVKAVAWQESGWQSNIVACDGGIGLMQVMPGTAKQINDRFGESYGINDYRDNAKLGANYLAWLVKYLGDLSGLGYRIDSGDCVDHTDPCLLNAVISAYNMGPGTVLVEKPDGTYDLKVSNIRYVDNVRTLMTECECLGF